jgi:hypothetical protein
MSSDAGWPWLAPDFFMFLTWKFQKKGLDNRRFTDVVFARMRIGLSRIQ